eukprot:COSAG02_NODE_7281_length_3086_cov_2.001004_2_plen_112_part_00
MRPGGLPITDNPVIHTSSVDTPKVPQSHLSRSLLLTFASGHSFGESGTIDIIEDYSSFKEHGDLWEWRRYRDGRTGRLFYVNSKTGDKQWSKPSRTKRTIRVEATLRNKGP